ncbi:down syndrome cell adhesion molecule-like protein Dscam2 [Caerostris extrusa]|uniref:Down syndrome cell adhesion molecule-like protein Dscam2 n=1 Tax=Caerostris extrusa TaxID=172846 RepID=A0AAV4YBW8_CAEEX|nr:down syndrome cell adhesion molecule-like protein Dscam2 [Caerostris extrusa]
MNTILSIFFLNTIKDTSRTAKISGLPFNGNNSAIIRYLVQCKSDSGDWDSGIQNITTGSEESSISLRGLRPARTYYFPGGPPLEVKAESVDSQSVRVTWRPPDVELWNGAY